MSEQEVPPLLTKPRQPRQTRKQKAVQTPIINLPALDDKEGWKTHWKSQGQPWRTEPEISRPRQRELTQNRSIAPDIVQGMYPFKGKTLTRADVEWLLATHENGKGPVMLQDDLQHDRTGLDLRGAILTDQDLRNLPLARLCAGVPSCAYDERSSVTREQSREARIHLARVKLDNADLMEAELSEALLHGASLDRTNLCKAHLDGADLGKASFKGTQLSEAYLREADLREAVMEYAHLEYAHLEHVQMAKASVKGSFLRVAHLEDADLREMHINKTDLSYVYLQKADLRQAQVHTSILYGARLQDARLEAASLQGCSLVEAHLEEADLRKAHLERANFSKAHLENADLVEASMEEATFMEAFLVNALFVQANLQRAILVKAHAERATFAGAILKEAWLNEASFAGADLREAHLEGANLQDAHFEGGQMDKDVFHQLSLELDGFLEVLPPADLRRAYCDAATKLDAICLGNEKGGFVKVADVNWGGANLAVVNWASMKLPGDEQAACWYQQETSRMARERKKAIKKEQQPALKKIVQDNENKQRAEEKKQSLINYQAAIRANRQLATALQAQGLNETAIDFAYRAQALQRSTLLQQKKWGQYLFSAFLALLAGYGYRPRRSLIAYLIIIFGFMGLYLLNAHFATPHLRWDEALVLSVSSFHGRGFFTQDVTLGDTYARLAAAEAVIGLFVEISFIATFTKRFLGN